MDNPVTQQYWTQKKVKERKVNTTRPFLYCLYIYMQTGLLSCLITLLVIIFCPIDCRECAVIIFCPIDCRECAVIIFCPIDCRECAVIIFCPIDCNAHDNRQYKSYDQYV
jgi:hypothetical protein